MLRTRVTEGYFRVFGAPIALGRAPRRPARGVALRRI